MKKLNITPGEAITHRPPGSKEVLDGYVIDTSISKIGTITIARRTGRWNSGDSAWVIDHVWPERINKIGPSPSEMAERIKALEDALEGVEKEWSLHREAEGFAVRRGSTWGILVKDDPNACGYQRVHEKLNEMRRNRRALLTPPIDEAHGHLLSNPQ